MGDIILVILIVLIKIGDGVLFVLKLCKQGLDNFFLYSDKLDNFFLRLLKNTGKKLSIRSRWHKKVEKRAKQKKTVHKPVPLAWLVKLKYFLFGIFFSCLFLFIPAIIIVFIQQLPNPEELQHASLPQTTKIYDRHHTLLYEIYATQNRTLVTLADVPQYFKEATVAIEDKNFYNNPGFDISAILRAALADISGKELQGGSTITQQLIKSTLLNPERTITRKVEEIILAFWAEKKFTKNQILQMYFNQVPYGGTAWGVEAGAETYFGKHVNDLDLAQCAFLAGLPRAPTLYSPYGNNPNLWKNRQKDVLQRMLELGYITKDQEKQAVDETLSFANPQIPLHAPHFSMYVKDLLIKKYGLPAVEKGGLEVITSLDLPLQETVQKIVTDEIGKNAYLHVTNGAAVVTNPKNGDILVMVGGKDYNSPDAGNYNIATALRQPGSSIKIVTYSAALAHGMTAATIIDDSPVSFPSQWGPSYAPVNYDGKFHSKIPLRIAFANSFNVPAVKTLNTIGIPTFIELAKNMGIKSLHDASEYGLSITLGGAEATMLDMATAYGTLANQGAEVDLNPILKAIDAKGQVLEEKKESEQKQVMDRGIAFIIGNILADNNARSWEFGSNSPLNIPGHTVSVKTGTSDNKRDNWTIGYTKNYAVTVWVGNNDNSPMSETLASGITGAAPIWHDIMSKLLEGKPDEKPIPPPNVVEKPCFGRTELFIAGTENSVSCTHPVPSGNPLRQLAEPTATPTPNQMSRSTKHTNKRRILFMGIL